MAKLQNVSLATRCVISGGERIPIAPGESASVDGRTKWAEHPMVVEGWLVVEEDAPKRKPPKKEPEPAQEVEDQPDAE